MSKKILPFNPNPPVSFFLHHALPLSMILADNKNLNFLHANFIQLNKSIKNDYLFDFYPRVGSAELYGMYPIDNVINNHILSGDIMKIRSDQIIKKTIDWIDQGYYVNINSDERYIENTEGYNSQKFHNHPGFYVGYDTDLCIFKMLNFDNSSHFNLIDIKFDNVVKSFQSEDLIASLDKKGYKNFLIQLRKVNTDIINYNYTDEKTIPAIQTNLYEYINSVDSSKRNMISYDFQENCIWGIETYSLFEKCINNEYSLEFIPECSCGMLEHKLLMKNRLEYLATKDCNLTDLIDDYDEIINYFKKFKLLALRSYITNNYTRFHSLNRNSSLNEIVEKEKRILNTVIERIH